MKQHSFPEYVTEESGVQQHQPDSSASSAVTHGLQHNVDGSMPMIDAAPTSPTQAVTIIRGGSTTSSVSDAHSTQL
jgi:hypothetical protein